MRFVFSYKNLQKEEDTKKERRRIMLKKADIVLIAGLLLVGLGLWSFFSFSKTDGSTVAVSVDGKTVGTYSLDEPNEFLFTQDGNENVVLIEDGGVRMKSSNCPGKECVHQGTISKSGETIICLPHRIILEITSDKPAYDVIVS